MTVDQRIAAMSDEELVQERTIASCTPLEDGGFAVTFSCGHESVFVIEPHPAYTVPCAQCINVLVGRIGRLRAAREK